MSSRHLLLLLGLPVLAGCGRTGATSAPPTAAAKPRVESELARTTLSARAVQSLALQSTVVEPRVVQEHLRLPGWVAVPQGHEVTLTAPLAGYVREPNHGGSADAGKPTGVPVAGFPVERDRLLFLLEPILTPVDQIQFASLKVSVEGEQAKAAASVRVAESEEKRIAGLHKQGLRGEQDLEQARTRLRHARADLAAAQEKAELLGTGKNGKLAPLPIRAPRAGTVLSVPVSPGQYVTATTPLVTIADLSQLWLRVPVPEADLPRLDRKGKASITLRTGQKAVSFSLAPLVLVPLVDPARRTADLIYAVPDEVRKAGLSARDQMVMVDVPLGRSTKQTVVPTSALVNDAHGGTWIYLDRTAPGEEKHTYERLRVETGASLGNEVVIRPALKPGQRILSRGAALVYSHEFYKPEGAAPAEIDDDD